MMGLDLTRMIMLARTRHNIFPKTVLYLTWQIINGEFILIISGSLAVRVKNHMVARPPATSGLSQSKPRFLLNHFFPLEER